MHRMLLAAVLAASISPPLAAQDAMTILHNARIYTVDAEDSVAEALAFEDGEIIAVGAAADLLDRFPEAERIDGEGRTVVPGLIDAHGHVMGLGNSLLQANLVGSRSVEDAVQRLVAFASQLPDDAWLQGRGWDQNEWPVAEFPTAADLDEAFPDRPVYLTRVDGHAAWVNSAAMALVGGLDETADLPGGRIIRDEVGAPTGVLIDAAMGLVRGEIPQPTPTELDLAMELALAETARYGLTGVHDAGLDLATIERFSRAIGEGRFPLRVYGMIGGPGSTLNAVCDHGPIEDVGGRLTVRSIKLYIDGALGSRGAALLEDYADEAGNTGLLLHEEEAFREVVRRSVDCGLQVNTHAIGDRGVRKVLDVYEDVLRGTMDGRHRVEHAQVVHPDDYGRFGVLGVVASMQPIHATSDMGWAEARLGEERTRGSYAWRTLLDHGTRLALGSDFPVEPVNPMLGIYAAVTRMDASGHPPGGWRMEEALTPAEALRGFTMDAAYAGFAETRLGSIEPGKRADFVILDRDILTIPLEEILEARVVATYLDGVAVYEAEN